MNTLATLRTRMIPRVEENTPGRDFILQVLLLSAIFLVGGAVIINQLEAVARGATYDGVPGHTMPIFLCVFLGLYGLFRLGLVIPAAWGVITLYFIGATYTAYSWGVDVPVALLVYALTIVLSAVLLGSRVSFFLTGGVAVILVGLYTAQSQQYITPDTYWKIEGVRLADIVTLILVMGVIAVVAWLYNRAITRAFHTMRESQIALRKERDNLEKRVIERTRELEKARMERLIDLYRQADFGRLAGGLFHDLVTPLNTISLNLEQLRDGHHRDKSKVVQTILRRAIRGTKTMERFVESVRQEIHQKETRSSFEVGLAVEQALRLLLVKAHESKVKIIVDPYDSSIRIFGSTVQFHQLVVNIVLNAIDSYEDFTPSRECIVRISVTQGDRNIAIRVHDHGKGIAHENLEKIFEPFFTTKAPGKGTGIGLSISQEIVRREFHGHIMVESTEGIGTTFSLMIPRTSSI